MIPTRGAGIIIIPKYFLQIFYITYTHGRKIFVIIIKYNVYNIYHVHPLLILKSNFKSSGLHTYVYVNLDCGVHIERVGKSR